MAKQTQSMYAGRIGPTTVVPNANIILGLFKKKNLVTFEDMQEATGRSWVRRFFHEAQTRRPNIVPVKEGRKLLGFTMQHGRRPVNDNAQSVDKIKVPKGYKLVAITRGRPRKAG